MWVLQHPAYCSYPALLRNDLGYPGHQSCDRADSPKMSSALLCTVMCCLHSCVLFCTALHCSVLFCAVLCCSVLFCAALGTHTWAALGPPSGTLAKELQGFLGHLGQCVMWLCSSHMLTGHASLHNLKLLADMVGYGISAPVTKFSHSERAKFSPPHSAKEVQWTQGSSCGHRTSWCAALNLKPRHVHLAADKPQRHGSVGAGSDWGV